MKLPSFFRTALAIAALGFTAGALRADIVTLKSGEKVEGKILEDSPDSIRIEYNLTPKIKDTKTIARSDIKEIKKQTAAEVEFKEKDLAKLLPTPDLMTVDGYESLIQDKLRRFAVKYPGSPEAAEAEKMITELSAEKAKVAGGELKVDGKWLDEATVKKDAYRIQSFSLHKAMKTDAAKPYETRYLDALRDFEKLRNTFPASLDYAQAIPEALEIMNTYEKQLSDMIAAQPALAADRDKGLRSMPQSEATTTRQAITKEETEYKRIRDQETKDKVTFKHIYAYNKKDLEESLATVQAQRRLVKAIDVDALRRQNEMFVPIYRYIAEEDAVQAEAALKQTEAALKDAAATAKPGDSTGIILQDLRKKTNDLLVKAKLNKRKADQQQNVAGPAINKDTPADNTNPLKAQLEKVEKDRKDKEEKLKAAKASKAEELAKQRAAMPPPPPEEESFISAYGMYIGIALVVILGGALVVSKRRKQQED